VFKCSGIRIRRGYNAIEDQRVTKFWKDYWNFIHENYPNIIMKEPSIKPLDSDWPILYLNWLPKYWEIVHKLSRGYIDLQTKLSKEEIFRYADIDNEINIVETGKSYSFRINVPKIDRLNDFYSQIGDIKICLEKIKIFNKLNQPM
jgi:hypothetical protein